MSIIPNINNEALQLLPDIALWKQQIADAINYKGGEASENSAFTQLAEDIKNIPNFSSYYNAFFSTLSVNRTETTSLINVDGIISDSLIEYDYKIGNYQFYNNQYITEAFLERVTEVGTFLFSYSKIRKCTISNTNTYTFLHCSELEEVNLLKTTIINGGCFYNCQNLKVLIADNVLEIKSINTPQGSPFYKTQIRVLKVPNCISLNSEGNILIFSNMTVLESIILGKLEIMNNNAGLNDSQKLQNISLGQDTDINLQFQSWNPTTIITEGVNSIQALNDNLYNNLLTKLYDHSQDGETRILRIGWLDYITPENIAYANAKGWTLTT